MVKVFQGSSRVLKHLNGRTLTKILKDLKGAPMFLNYQKSSMICAKVARIQSILEKIIYFLLSIT